MPSWDVVIDWSRVYSMIGLGPDDVESLPKGAREQAIEELQIQFGVNSLFEKDPQEIDRLVADTLSRILKKKNFFQKREKVKEKAKKDYINNMPRIEIFPMDNLPEEFKQMIEDAMSNGQGADLKDMFEEFFSKYMKSKGKFKTKDGNRKRDGEEEDANRSMYI